MTDADFAAALRWALIGPPERGSDGADLADDDRDAPAIAKHARMVIATGGIWPHPVPEELRRRAGSARLLAAVQEAQLRLGLFGEPAPPVAHRPLDADERRLLQDVPPHHGS